MKAQVLKVNRVFSNSEGPALSEDRRGSSCSSWGTQDFILAHNLVVESGKYNFEGCKIPVPTSIRYDRITEALGDSVDPKE